MSRTSQAPDSAETGSELRVGIRQLKTNLSAYLRRIKSGESLVITDHGEPVGRLVPLASSPRQTLQQLEEAGVLAWDGGKPSAEIPPIPTGEGPTVADLLLEDRD